MSIQDLFKKKHTLVLGQHGQPSHSDIVAVPKVKRATKLRHKDQSNRRIPNARARKRAWLKNKRDCSKRQLHVNGRTASR